MRAKDILEIASLSTPEKILFVEDLWNNITLDELSVDVPHSHINELERRLKNMKELQEICCPWRNFNQKQKKGNEIHTSFSSRNRG